jgi:GYF domain 2
MKDEWFVARRGQDGNKRYGPVPLEQLRELVDAGKVQPADLVWREGMANWLRADQCEDLFPAPPPGPRRDARDYPASQDRRSYSAGPGRGPRGYGPDDDDRPYPRRRYPQQQSSGGGWIIALVIGGVAVLLLVGCGGLLAFGLYSARSAPMMKPTMAMKTMPTFPAAPPGDPNHGDVFQPPFGGPAANLGNVLPPFRGNSQLYYTAEVRPDQARALGDYLDGQGVFPETRPVTVQLTNPFGTYQVRFCVKAGTE